MRRFRLPIDLEAHYTDTLWARAAQQGWLEDNEDLSQVLNQRMLHDLASRGANPFEGLDEAAGRRVRSVFTSEGKVKAAAYLAGLPEEKARVELAAFEPVIQVLAEHLLPR
ncbi:MAG: hypothetical protein DI570_17790 [Phenylobacterium zucineum]|nr:MAG: hypothetical protein DI570_17790 [Phenylobacterium zucineum]